MLRCNRLKNQFGSMTIIHRHQDKTVSKYCWQIFTKLVINCLFTFDLLSAICPGKLRMANPNGRSTRRVLPIPTLKANIETVRVCNQEVEAARALLVQLGDALGRKNFKRDGLLRLDILYAIWRQWVLSVQEEKRLLQCLIFLEGQLELEMLPNWWKERWQVK